LPPSEPPTGWERTYEIIKALRADRDAPVDTLGGAALPENNVSEHVRQYQILISLMLSSQTKDTTNAEAMRSLQKHGLTVDKILATSSKKLNSLIKKVGFHNNKTKYILRATQILKDEHGSRVPRTAEELVALPGVGPKMALLVLQLAHGINAGIGVDTHVHRMCWQLGWTKQRPLKEGQDEGKNRLRPEDTRVQLESWLPCSHWAEINLLFVGIGQEIQTEKGKLLRKCLALRLPKPARARRQRSRKKVCAAREALALVARLGLNVPAVAKKEGLEVEVESVAP
jgi:endonuclease-3